MGIPFLVANYQSYPVANRPTTYDAAPTYNAGLSGALSLNAGAFSAWTVNTTPEAAYNDSGTRTLDSSTYNSLSLSRSPANPTGVGDAVIIYKGFPSVSIVNPTIHVNCSFAVKDQYATDFTEVYSIFSIAYTYNTGTNWVYITDYNGATLGDGSTSQTFTYSLADYANFTHTGTVNISNLWVAIGIESQNYKNGAAIAIASPTAASIYDVVVW